jgi:hypothetical protein
MTTILLDPTPEQTPATRPRLQPPASLDGLTIALLDISKPRGNVLLDRLETHFAGRGVNVKRYMKPSSGKTIPLELAQTIAAECNIVVEGLAD